MRRPDSLYGRLFLAACAIAAFSPAGLLRSQTAGKANPPNILFVIMDDVGIDQLSGFNPAAGTSALTPNLGAVMYGGVKFTKFYTMPECSPSRAAFFTGRYPLRTGVTAAILAEDLPAAQVSPYEVTTPRIMAKAGYANGLIGKYHLGGPENNPDGNNAPIALGWNYFNGNMRGGPPPIDPSLGGQYTKDNKKYSSGFPAGTQTGAAWFVAPGSSKPFCDDRQGAGYTGREAVTLGGIAALDEQGNFAATCATATRTAPNFAAFNGYYVWPQVVADSGGVKAQPSRQYMTTAQTDAAISWIQSQRKGTAPWMATVSYNSLHTPYQQPPASLYPPGFVWPAGVPEDPSNAAAQRVISDLMLASLDREIGRLLIGAGLAVLNDQGQLLYDPSKNDTMVVIVGDNGTFVASVKPPYDPLRAKGTPYETGVLAPLIVSGPLVQSPGRTVDAQVNAVDLFQLFGEIAGVDVRSAVPASHPLDSQPLLPYLTNAFPQPIRQYNFTQLGAGLKPPAVKLWPCVVTVGPVNIATDTLFTTQNICETNAGTWYGPTLTQPNPQYPSSCSILQAGLYKNLTILPAQVWAIRDSEFKLVKVDRPPCLAPLGQYEFYDLAPTAANPAGIDLSTGNLLTNGEPTKLNGFQLLHYSDLMLRLQALLGSEQTCYGDGNLDKKADLGDLSGLVAYFGQPSVFDFNADGVTNQLDFPWVLNNFGNNCLLSGSGTAPH